MFIKILNVVYCSQTLLLLTLFGRPKPAVSRPKIGVTVKFSPAPPSRIGGVSAAQSCRLTARVRRMRCAPRRQEGANCHVGLGHGSGESDKLYSSPKNGCNGCNGRCNGHVPASQILLLFTDPTVVLLLLLQQLNTVPFSPQR